MHSPVHACTDLLVKVKAGLTMSTFLYRPKQVADKAVDPRQILPICYLYCLGAAECYQKHINQIKFNFSSMNFVLSFSKHIFWGRIGLASKEASPMCPQKIFFKQAVSFNCQLTQISCLSGPMNYHLPAGKQLFTSKVMNKHIQLLNIGRLTDF